MGRLEGKVALITGAGSGMGRAATHAFVHGKVCQAIGFLIAFPQRVLDGKPLKFGNHLLRALVEIQQRRILYPVLASYLFDHQFRVSDDL